MVDSCDANEDIFLPVKDLSVSQAICSNFDIEVSGAWIPHKLSHFVLGIFIFSITSLIGIYFVIVKCSGARWRN